jgi:hypothetical protein
MNSHPYLRAYMAGIAAPTPLLLVALTLFSILRYACGVPIPVERIIIFPMALIPNLFGAWNMLHLVSRSQTRLPLGIHGAILPFLLVPAGYFLGHSLGLIQADGSGVDYFGVVDVPYTLIALGFLTMLVLYYLVWKYLIGFFNRVAGIAEY